MAWPHTSDSHWSMPETRINTPKWSKKPPRNFGSFVRNKSGAAWTNLKQSVCLSSIIVCNNGSVNSSKPLTWPRSKSLIDPKYRHTLLLLLHSLGHTVWESTHKWPPAVSPSFWRRRKDKVKVNVWPMYITGSQKCGWLVGELLK